MATKEWMGCIATLVIFCSLFVIGLSAEDVPCKPRNIGIEGRSVVCVCDAGHCDTITRVSPQRENYVMYTTSRAGQRFEVSRGRIRSTRDPPETSFLNQYADVTDTEEDVDTAFDVPSYLDEDRVPDYENPPGFDTLPDPNVPSDLDISILSTLVNKHVLEQRADPYEEDDRPTRPTWPEHFPDLPDLSELPDLPPIARRNATTITVFPSQRHQVIEGFGGSVTDAAAINWISLSNNVQKHLIDSYFGPNGLEYNLIRVPIGGSDFSTRPYTLNDYPWNDHTLSNFSLAFEDYAHKLPMIKAIMDAAPSEVKVTASTWSPPVWMKTNERITGFGQLKAEHFQTYADYHLRFLEEYEKNDVKIWAITTTNEPLNGIVPAVRFNSLGFTPWQLAKYIVENIGPAIRNSRFNQTLILGIDDQRYMLPIYLRGRVGVMLYRVYHCMEDKLNQPKPRDDFDALGSLSLNRVTLHGVYTMAKEDPRFWDYMDGIAIHYYGNFVPPAILGMIQSRLPNNKILLSTEACEGAAPWQQSVEEGSWQRARRYVTSILQDLNNHVVGWIDWNLCLDRTGGPNWAGNFVDSPILVNRAQDEFVKQPMFYAMGHFSKFIPRGSQVLSTSRRGATLEHIAVMTPQNNIVVVAQNRRKKPLTVTIFVTAIRFITFEMEAESLKTVEFSL